MSLIPLPWTGVPPKEVTGGAVAVGNFDGVHLGHRQLVMTARRWADRLGGPAVAVTFDPPPVNLLDPARARPPLSTIADRAELLHIAGADHVVVLQTDAGLLSLSPEAFFEEVLHRQLRARAMVEGYNFHFGRNRTGDNNLLRKLCAKVGIAFEEVPPILVREEAVSSSRVRFAVAAGDVPLARELLGRFYRISGTVVEGARRGRTIGFPTANLEGVESLVPALGVYAAWAVLEGQRFPAAVNLGPNPTFGEEARKIEVHLIDFAGNLYGRQLGIEFVERLRDVRSFGSVAELTSQLGRDIQAARSLLEISQ
jgi:riboflavin kinase/FMN adenylyltransferase